MADALPPETKLEIYRLVLQRYKDLINEKEALTISEIRQKVSPYNDLVRKIRDEITKDMVPYNSKTQFFDAAQRAISHVREIRTCEFAFSFWMSFEEIERLKIATAMDKAILLAALLRSLESEDVRVVVTSRGRPYVRFSTEERRYLFVPESGSLLVGEDALEVFSNDNVSYSFSDLMYENHEEQ
ncbi:hypothetical protein GF318_04190 [Candidatus Micrarchaeota archaeon]|nr:hypothetical protein [Candidatus Micrarchaeota archaeon]